MCDISVLFFLLDICPNTKPLVLQLNYEFWKQIYILTNYIDWTDINPINLIGFEKINNGKNK